MLRPQSDAFSQACHRHCQFFPFRKNSAFHLNQRSGHCVNAEPAAVFSDLLNLLSRSTFAAAAPALEHVAFEGAFLWDSADPAADFADLLDLLSLSTLDAADAARLLVTSRFFAIINSLMHGPLRFSSQFYTNIG